MFLKRINGKSRINHQMRSYVGACSVILLACGIAGGSIRVELLDENDKPIKGYTRDDATRLYDNSVHLPVTWGTNDSVAALSAKPINIRFLMRDCKLYAFQFTETP
jgi:hypothetical protein